MEGKKLKRMLELKRRIEKVKKGEVASARQEQDVAQLELSAAQNEQRVRLEALQNAHEVSVTELADRARFLVQAGQQVGVAREVVAKSDRKVLHCEEDRVLATRDVRTFEVLTERDREARRLIDKTNEQRAADDIASSRWSHRT